jgi:queuine tRNA-ribosyltransferase
MTRSSSTLTFTVDDNDATSSARTGTLSLAHGEVETPAFMPVGTVGSVKGIHHDTLVEMGYRLILANTYHLFLRPGMDVMVSAGGLHRFSTWEHNILTDSGGYQIFSLAPFRTISNEGATFRSHIDGSQHTLTPERVVEIQVTIGSDIQMVLDVCTGADEGRKAAEAALATTDLWAGRARAQWHLACEKGYHGALFGIVQGNFYPDLRTRSVEQTVSRDFPGIAIGGLSVGETFEQFEAMLAHTAPQIPAELPKYVMGIGTPEYILTAIEHGIDMFDCVFPTRAGRTGTLFTTKGRLNIRNARFAHDDDPIDETLLPPNGRSYSLGYLRHLFKANEMLGPMIATEHNLRFLKWLVDQARAAIHADRFIAFKREFLANFSAGDGKEIPGD